MEMEMPTTPEPALTALSKEIAGAQKALIALVQSKPDEQWHAYALKTKARNGWSSGAMTLALNQLIEDGTFEVEGAFIRLRS